MQKWNGKSVAQRNKPFKAKFTEKTLRDAWRPVWMLPLLIFGATMVLTAWIAFRASNFDARFKFSKILGRLLLVNILILQVYLFGASIPLIGVGIHYLTVPDPGVAGLLLPTWQGYVIAFGMLCVFALSRLLIDVNRISWHNFYRDRRLSPIENKSRR